MSISYEEVREIMGGVAYFVDEAVSSDPECDADWSVPECDLVISWIKDEAGTVVDVSNGAEAFASCSSVTQLRHLLAGLGVREWDGGEDQGDSISDLLRRLRELCAVLSLPQEEAILRIDDEGTWSAECHAIDGRGDTPEDACRAAIRDARASLSARANQLEARAAELRRLAEGVE